MEKDNKRLLVHACCAPCLVAVYDNISTNLAEFGINSIEDFDVIWYNNRIAVIIVGSRGKKYKVSLRSLLYGIIDANYEIGVHMRTKFCN